jgi:GDP-L-fucose synthase
MHMQKRSLAQLTQWYREQHQCDFVSVLPDNFFGAYGDFNPKTAPLVNSLIAKMENQREDRSLAPLTMMGTGTPLRQVMFAHDLARIVIWALENYNENEPLVVAGEDVSISQIAQLVCEQIGFTGFLQFDDNTKNDGPLSRTADTSRFEELYPSFKMTPISMYPKKHLNGIESTKLKNHPMIKFLFKY